MEENTGQHSKEDSNQPDPEVVVPATIPEQQQRSKPAPSDTTENEPPYVRESRIKRMWKELGDVGADRKIELGLSVAIVLFAAAQFVNSCTGSRQMDKLIFCRQY